jgi:release factor glutamine methyltransferase
LLTTGHSSAPGRLDLELLLANVTGRNRGFILAHPEYLLSHNEIRLYQQLLERRQQGEPLAYILGYREFWGLQLKVSAAVLIPRPETELLVEEALNRWPERSRGIEVLDLGTGSGAIALALASEQPVAQITATDISTAALAIARQNAVSLGLKVRFLHSDWFDAVSGRFELIVSNPPYIAASDPHLSDPALKHEPRLALQAGPRGLNAIARIIREAPEYLRPDGLLLLEHGYDQGAAVRQMLIERGFQDVCTLQDLGQQDRVTLGRWPARAPGQSNGNGPRPWSPE